MASPPSPPSTIYRRRRASVWHHTITKSQHNISGESSLVRLRIYYVTATPFQKEHGRTRAAGRIVNRNRSMQKNRRKRREWIPLFRLALPLAIAHSGSRYITLHIESPGADELLTGQHRSGAHSSPQKRSTIPIPFAAMMNPIII